MLDFLKNTVALDKSASRPRLYPRLVIQYSFCLPSIVILINTHSYATGALSLDVYSVCSQSINEKHLRPGAFKIEMSIVDTNISPRLFVFRRIQIFDNYFRRKLGKEFKKYLRLVPILKNNSNARKN